MKPYYQDPHVTLYLGDCREVLPAIDVVPDHVITDPPFATETHEGARSMRDKGEGEIIPYAPVTPGDIRAVLGGVARPKRWCVATMDYRHVLGMEVQPPEGLRFVRFGVWSKRETGAPQITGDRPAMGWEAIAILHADVPGRMKWNGGGKDAVYEHAIARGDIPEEKPLGLIAEFVRDFTDEGDLILDPWCGHFTTGRAAKDLGRRAIGIEIDERRIEHAARRMAQESLFSAARAPSPTQVALFDAPKMPRAKQAKKSAA